VITVVGARPQFVKAAPVSRALASNGVLEELVVHTGQHFDAEMSDVFFADLEMQPAARNLGIHGGSHAEMTARMLVALETILMEEQPAVVMVYGDTNSTLAGALAACKMQVPVAHVEAGLRSFNRLMPEETNRVVADHVSELLLCPTGAAMANLAREGLSDRSRWVGDVMYDAALTAAPIAKERSNILQELGLQPEAYAVATIHRAENTDDAARLMSVVDYLEASEFPVVMPLHPRTREAVERSGLGFERVTTIAPLGYLDMTMLVQSAACVLTDSGGLQKEAYFHRVPCVTLRDETEWVETVAAGWNRLWTSDSYFPRADISEYGDGHAAEAVARALVELVERAAR
jgi:UDP-GlcNAc3NAcA epimerase